MTRDSEFNDSDLERLLALRRYEAGICDCGIHESLIDPANVFTFDKKVCTVCRGKAQYMRVLAAEDTAAEERLKTGDKPAPPQVARPSDGRHIYLRQLSETEISQRRSTGSPPESAR